MSKLDRVVAEYRVSNSPEHEQEKLDAIKVFNQALINEIGPYAPTLIERMSYQVKHVVGDMYVIGRITYHGINVWVTRPMNSDSPWQLRHDGDTTFLGGTVETRMKVKMALLNLLANVRDHYKHVRDDHD